MLKNKSSHAPKGLFFLITSSLLAGILSYLLNIIVIRGFSPEQFVYFASFWAALYFSVGVLSGLQQEVTRTSGANDGERNNSSSSKLTNPYVAISIVITAVIIFAIVTAIFIPDSYFGFTNGISIPLLLIGASSYVFVATISGLLYGSRNAIITISLMILLDSLLRVILIFLVVLLGLDLFWLDLSVVLPFALVPVFLLQRLRKHIDKKIMLQISLAQLIKNFSITMLAAAAMSFLVSGLPLILRTAFSDASDDLLASVIFVTTLARAPLIILAMSIQSYLISIFQSTQKIRIMKYFLFIAALTAILFLTLDLWGDYIFSTLADEQINFTFDVYLSIAISSGAISMLYIAGAQLLAKNHHYLYLALWILTAVITLVLSVIDLPVNSHLNLILAVPPVTSLLLVFMPYLIREKIATWRHS